MKKNEITIIREARSWINIFSFIGRPLLSAYFFKCFLYKFVPANQAAIFSEPLVKQNSANNRKGVDGNTGSIMPSVPTAKSRNPAVIYIILLIAATSGIMW